MSQENEMKEWANPTPAGLVALAVACFGFFAILSGRVTHDAMPLLGAWLLGGFVVQFIVALLDLKAVDEFWFTSQLDIKQIEANLEAEQSIKLVNEKNKKLFCVKGGSELLWKKTSEKLYSSDSRFTNLGNAAQSLMPLFAELANESF